MQLKPHFYLLGLGITGAPPYNSKSSIWYCFAWSKLDNVKLSGS